MAGLVTNSQKMSIYLDLLLFLKAKVSANHLIFACYLHCKTVYLSCRLTPSLVPDPFPRKLLDSCYCTICLTILQLKLENTNAWDIPRFELYELMYCYHLNFVWSISHLSFAHFFSHCVLLVKISPFLDWKAKNGAEEKTTGWNTLVLLSLFLVFTSTDWEKRRCARSL